MSTTSTTNPDELQKRIAALEAQSEAQRYAMRAVLDEFRRLQDEQPYARIHYEAHTALVGAIPAGPGHDAAYAALGQLFRQDEE